MWKQIGGREAGQIRPNSFSNRVKSNRVSSLQLSNYKDIVSPHRGSINSLQVDLTEGRYLLSGASDASVAVYDVQRATDYEGGGLIAKHKSIVVVDKQHEQGHKYAVSSAIWYPIDTGLFITGSYDHYVKVWDTNSIQVVMNFKMPGKVYRTAMSSLATSHMLIAAGTEDVQVRLCDIASGAFSHTLSGHRDGIMTVEWSTSSEWVLVTGGCDGAIRFWDIRRAGCFRVLDQSQSQLGRRPPLLERSALNKVSTSKSLSVGQNLSAKSRPQQRKSTNGNGVKQSPIGRIPAKASVRQRLHPGMLSGQDRKPVEPPKPKEVIPFICELCNVKCESQVVFNSHLVGKKHIANVKRFHGHRALYGEAGLQALYPPNLNASSSSVTPQLQQGVNDPQVLLAQLLTYVLAQAQTPGLLAAQVPGLAAAAAPVLASSQETQYQYYSQTQGPLVISEAENKIVTLEAEGQPESIKSEPEVTASVSIDTNASLPQDNPVIASLEKPDDHAEQDLSAAITLNLSNQGNNPDNAALENKEQDPGSEPEVDPDEDSELEH